MGKQALQKLYETGYGGVHALIRDILRKKKCLRRHEIWAELAKTGHQEGDVGRRLREMGDVECRYVRTKIHGWPKMVWVYSLKG